MRIRVGEEIRADHEEIRRLVVEGFDGVDRTGVEVQVRRARRQGESFTGRAYFTLPSRPRPHPETTFLVKLSLPGTLRNRAYPKTYRYWNRKTAPWITVRDWRERLVALVAHEACHVRQFRDGLRRSEVEAERWAASTLNAWRAGGVGAGTAALDEVPPVDGRAVQLVLPLTELTVSAAG
jgi:hypothetical protein